MSPFRTGIFQTGAYVSLLPGFVICYFIVILLSGKRVSRGFRFRAELIAVTKCVVAVIIITIFYLFMSRTVILYSREFLIVFGLVFWFLMLFFRVVLKTRIMSFLRQGKNAEQVVVIGKREVVSKELNRIEDGNDWRFRVSGIIFTDVDMQGERVGEISVIANASNMMEILKEGSIDSVVMVYERIDDDARKQVKDFHDMGKAVYIDLDRAIVVTGAGKSIDKIGAASMICLQPVARIAYRRLFFKRFTDILLSILLMPLLLIFMLISAILLNIESPGPLMLSRIRVGNGGRRFEQLRFRIMRMDAKERLKKGKNPMTVWGRFLSFSHFDRLPLILNVLVADMSFVGPHAPRLPRFIEYGAERRKNLRMRPGILGHWSFELDEEKIITEEREYIEHWSMFSDFSVFLEFIFRYITGRLVRGFDPDQAEEEIWLIDQYYEEKQPFEYDRSAYTEKATFKISTYGFFKRMTDIVLSLVAIIILSPLFLILMILIMGSDGGSPIYAHRRIGKNGKKINIYKFRSMRKDAGDLEKLLNPEQLEQYNREFKIEKDPRVTGIGNFLRRTSLDELPQLFNILGGSLSIVGPRPIVEDETEKYGKEIAKLLFVKPGLTGYWQAYARNNASYETGERQAMEMYYVNHRGIKLDVKIFFKTIVAVFRQEGVEL